MRYPGATLVVIFAAGVLVGGLVPPAWVGTVKAQAESPASQPRTVWYFYRVQWGHQDEFVELFRKNHYPVLKAQLGDRIRDFKAYTPTYHGDGRADWTFATALTFRDALAMTIPADEGAIARKLFPDIETFRKEERRRFEILDAHWDVPITEVKME